jgi:glycosyltransferase involved in cell wall biosynthesis
VVNLKYNLFIDGSDKELHQYEYFNIDENIQLIVGAALEWTLQAYLILKQRNTLNVVLSNDFLPNCVNIIHSADLIKFRGTPKDFIVCIKGDYPWRRWAHYHIVQNQNELAENSSLLPLWVQPGLIGRNPQRKGVIRIAYAGQTWNGNLAGSTEAWIKLFEPHGIEFVTLPTGACHDLSDIDVLIGIRSFDTHPYNSKPPSKLINAWHAHIPFIGGYDSAFKQVGIPGQDYLLAKTPDEVLHAVLSLRDNPELYQTLISNGSNKASLYTRDTIAEKWENIFSEPVLQRYKQWTLRSNYEQNRFETLSRFESIKHESKQLLKRIIKVH